jgi:dihydrodipicolinate synthase/N-acetylneuraminate lyase
VKELYPLFGIVTVLNTPFKTESTIDFRALKTNGKLPVIAGAGETGLQNNNH